MQEEYRKKIISYLADKERECFSGGVKIGFEHGRPSSISENLNPDTSVPIKADFDMKEQIITACTGDFFGTLFFVYDNGRITHFNRIKTIQGPVLNKMLDDYIPPPHRIKPRVTVGIRRPTNA